MQSNLFSPRTDGMPVNRQGLFSWSGEYDDMFSDLDSGGHGQSSASASTPRDENALYVAGSISHVRSAATGPDTPHGAHRHYLALDEQLMEASEQASAPAAIAAAARVRGVPNAAGYVYYSRRYGGSEVGSSGDGSATTVEGGGALDAYEEPDAATLSAAYGESREVADDDTEVLARATLSGSREDTDVFPFDESAPDYTARYTAIYGDDSIDLLQRGPRMRQLLDLFVSTSEQIAKTIIDELVLPPERRTYKPLDLGYAGGLKYAAKNIFFKLAADNHGLFERSRSVECAMKVAAHELKGVSAAFLYGLTCNLSFPLMCVVDWKGHRVCALSRLPISGSTLVYGSNDGGRTVRRQCGAVAEAIEKVATSFLNLKLHDVRGEMIAGPFDIEGHHCHEPEERMFCVDLARLFPAEPPQAKGERFYKLLRPEFTRKWRRQLNSDAFTRFSTPADDDEVRRAHHFLMHQLLPQFATELISGDSLRLKLASRGSDVLSSAGQQLVEQMHRVGINCRHLGALARCVRQQSTVASHAGGLNAEHAADECEGDSFGPRLTVAFRLLLIEMISRVVKHETRALMRAAQERVSPRRAARGHTTLDKGELFAFVAKVFDEQNGDSAWWWQVEVKLLLRDRFGGGFLAPSELDEAFDYRVQPYYLGATGDRCADGRNADAGKRRAVFLRLLYERVAQVLELQFTHKGAAQCSFERMLRIVREKRSEALQFRAKTRSVFVGDRIEADTYSEQARRREAYSVAEARSLYEMAFEKYASCLARKTDDVEALVNFGVALHRHGKLLSADAGVESLQRAEKQFQISRAKLLEAEMLLPKRKNSSAASVDVAGALHNSATGVIAPSLARTSSTSVSSTSATNSPVLTSHKSSLMRKTESKSRALLRKTVRPQDEATESATLTARQPFTTTGSFLVTSAEQRRRAELVKPRSLLDPSPDAALAAGLPETLQQRYRIAFLLGNSYLSQALTARRRLAVAAGAAEGEALYASGGTADDAITLLFNKSVSSYERALRLKDSVVGGLPENPILLLNAAYAYSCYARCSKYLTVTAQRRFRCSSEFYRRALDVLPAHARATARTNWGCSLLEKALWIDIVYENGDESDDDDDDDDDDDGSEGVSDVSDRFTYEDAVHERRSVLHFALHLFETSERERTNSAPFQLACAYAMLNRADACRSALQRALTNSESPKEMQQQLVSDPHFANVRNLTWYRALCGEK